MHRIDGLAARYEVLDRDDLRYMAGRYASAADFAEKLVEAASPHAATARDTVETLWSRWDAEGTRGDDGDIPAALAGVSELARHVASAIGATAASRRTEPDWGSEMIASPDGYVLATPSGSIFLDATVMPERRAVWMSQLSCEIRGEGLGTTAMEAIRDFALDRGLDVVVFKVTNDAFFGRFSWLSAQGGMTYGMIAPTSEMVMGR